LYHQCSVLANDLDDLTFCWYSGRMMRSTIIRPFDGSLSDAEGLLAVERETFDESPYSPDQVCSMLAADAQHAWLAIGQGRVVGFVAGFPTTGLRGLCWEIDLLAVHPDWTGRGLATRLVRTAAAQGMRVARKARAAIASDNSASARAFARAGFQRAAACELFIRRLEGQSAQPWFGVDLTVGESAGVAEVGDWLSGQSMLVGPGLPLLAQDEQQIQGLVLMVAERRGQLSGHVELIEVQTLLYRGLWIESLSASTPLALTALIQEAVNRAVTMGLDEIGMLVPEQDRLLGEAFLLAGFHSLGMFDWFTADLPLPGLASSVDPA
jgi:GNAT superfamily N-acetyltransferase